MTDEIPEAWRAAQRRLQNQKIERLGGRVAHSGIGDVTEGPIVVALAAVFRQFEEMGVGRASDQ